MHKVQIEPLNRAFTQKDVNPHISHANYRYTWSQLDKHRQKLFHKVLNKNRDRPRKRNGTKKID
jgi:hypothetical protein